MPSKAFFPGPQSMLAKHVLVPVPIPMSCSIYPPSSPSSLLWPCSHTICLHLPPEALLRVFHLCSLPFPHLGNNSLANKVVEYSRSEHQQSATRYKNKVSVPVALFHAAQSNNDEDIEWDTQHTVNTGADSVFDEAAFEVSDL